MDPSDRQRMETLFGELKRELKQIHALVNSRTIVLMKNELRALETIMVLLHNLAETRKKQKMAVSPATLMAMTDTRARIQELQRDLAEKG